MINCSTAYANGSATSPTATTRQRPGSFTPQGRPHEAEWTADRLKLFITNYGSDQPLADGRRMTVTPIEAAQGRQDPYQDVTRFEDRPPMIEFDLPLDGEWSDLTAIFDLIDVGGGWAFALQDLHVL